MRDCQRKKPPNVKHLFFVLSIVSETQVSNFIRVIFLLCCMEFRKIWKALSLQNGWYAQQWFLKNVRTELSKKIKTNKKHIPKYFGNGLKRKNHLKTLRADCLLTEIPLGKDLWRTSEGPLRGTLGSRAIECENERRYWGPIPVTSQI